MEKLADPNEGLSLKKIFLGLAVGAFTLGAVAACDAPDEGAPGGQPMDQGGQAPAPPD